MTSSEIPAPLPPDHKAWKLLYVHTLAALAEQTPKLRKALLAEIPTLPEFRRAIADGLLQVSPLIKNDGVYYKVAVRVSDGVAPLLTVHSMRVGMSDELLDCDRRLAAAMGWVEVTVPDDASGLDEDA